MKILFDGHEYNATQERVNGNDIVTVEAVNGEYREVVTLDHTFEMALDAFGDVFGASYYELRDMRETKRLETIVGVAVTSEY